MNRFIILFVIFVSFFCIGCKKENIHLRAHDVYYFTKSVNDPSVFGDNFDWQNNSPIDFLDMLTKRSSKYSYTVAGVHKNWIKKSDIPELIELLDSSVTCSPVNMVISSYAELNGSTIGDEAAFLILGFKKGEYPPGLNSTRPRLNQNGKEELKKWWREFK